MPVTNVDSSIAYGPLGVNLTPQSYTSLGTLLDPTKPDVRELYVQTFGDQGLTGFLDLTGAIKNAGTADEVSWYEEGRLHRTVNITHAALTAGTDAAFTITADNSVSTVTNSEDIVRPNDVLLVGGTRILVKSVTAAATFTGVPLVNSAARSTAASAAVIGNMYAQGTSQPGKFYDTSLQKRSSSFLITKETFHVNGSQATNIGWLKVNGQYRWYVKGEMDARKRFMNQREAMMLWAAGKSTTAATITTATGTLNQPEGYFAAIENRGITTDGFSATATLKDIDDIIIQLDVEGAPNEYAMYVNRQLSLDIDDMLAGGITKSGGLANQFGAFNNDPDFAIKLGFKSFNRGGYTFHKHDWKLLNDPTMGGLGNVRGAMVPMSQVADAKTGVKSPSLEMCYKAANGYSRDVEHWVEGGGVLGFATNDQDVAKFHYRSECNLITRAANQHVLIK
jgi:hypothetical protein